MYISDAFSLAIKNKLKNSKAAAVFLTILFFIVVKIGGFVSPPLFLYSVKKIITNRGFAEAQIYHRQHLHQSPTVEEDIFHAYL